MDLSAIEALHPSYDPERRSLVLSRDASFAGGEPTEDSRPPGVETASSLDQALAQAAEGGEHGVFVAGGASVFAEALPRADRLYLTRVHAEIEGDVYFPELDFEDWKLVEQQRREADERHAYALTFQTFDRR